MPFLRRRWPWLLVILFPLLPLWRAVFLGEAIGPFDQIRQMAPWNGPAPDRPFDVLQADAVLQFYPWRDMVFEAWGKGQLPLWNSYQLAGTPLLANSQSAGFYPPHILMGVLHIPTHWAITLLAWFHLALAGLGVMALARRLGATPEGGAIGGVLFSGSAFMLAWTALPSVISTVAWIPWVLYGVYGLFEGACSTNDERQTTNEISQPARPQDRKTATPNTSTPNTLPNTSLLQHFKTFSGLAFSTGMMLLSGHLQFAFYGLLAAAFVLVFLFAFALFEKSYKFYPFRGLILGVVALAVGGGLAAPQLLPVLEYSKFSHRRNVPSEEGYKAYVAGAIAPFELVGLIYPTAVGLPFEFAPDAKPLSQYWPALVKQGANFAEGAIGIGPLALFGLLMFPWRRTPKRIWVPIAMLGVLAFLMALGTIVNKPFYFLIPGWSSTGSPGRIGVLFVLVACVIAASSFQTFLSALEQYSKRRAIASIAMLVVVAASMLAQIKVTESLHPRFPGMDPSILENIGSRAHWISTITITLFIVITLGYAGTIFRERHGRSETYLWVFLGSFAALSHPLLMYGIVPSGRPLVQDEMSVLSDPVARSAFINDPWELVVAAPATMPPNTASLLRIHDLAGYDSLLQKDTHLFLGYVNGQDPAPPANGNMQFIKPTADLRKLSEAGVSFVYSRAPSFGMAESDSMENGLMKYKLEGPGRAYFVKPGSSEAPTPVEIVDGYDRQFIDVTGPGTLVVKDRLMPGWKAIVGGTEKPWSKHPDSVWKSPDGREVQMWRAVDIPEGRFNVDFVYDPPGLKTGLIIFVPCFLVTVGSWMMANKRRTIDDKR